MKTIVLGMALVLAAALLGMLRYGFIPVRTADYPLKASEFQSWDQVFKTQGKFSLQAWQTGSGLVKSRAKNLDEEVAKRNGFQDSATPVPMWVFYLNHPVWGAMLVDTGFDKSFSGPSHGNYNLFARLYTRLVAKTRHVQAAGQSLDEHLATVPVKPARVFFTHLHFDHTAGLPALSGQEQIVVGKHELDFASRALVGHYLVRFSKIRELDLASCRPMPPFAHAADLLGDGSLWAVSTPGHTPGHLSYVVMTTDGPVLITGDACMYYQALKQGIGPFSQYPGDKAKSRESLREIREFLKMYPQVKVFVGHDDLKNQPQVR